MNGSEMEKTSPLLQLCDKGERIRVDMNGFISMARGFNGFLSDDIYFNGFLSDDIRLSV